MRETWRYGARVSPNRTTIDQPPLEKEQKIVAPDQLSTDSLRLEPLYAQFLRVLPSTSHRSRLSGIMCAEDELMSYGSSSRLARNGSQSMVCVRLVGGEWWLYYGQKDENLIWLCLRKSLRVIIYKTVLALQTSSFSWRTADLSGYHRPGECSQSA